MSRAALVVDGEAVMKVLEVGDKTKYGATLKELTSAENQTLSTAGKTGNSWPTNQSFWLCWSAVYRLFIHV